MWLVRQPERNLQLFTNKPIKELPYKNWSSGWFSPLQNEENENYNWEDMVNINSQLFPQIKWEDENPTEIEIKIKE